MVKARKSARPGGPVATLRAVGYTRERRPDLRRSCERWGEYRSGQLPLYPVTNYHTPGTPSYEDNAEGYRLTRHTMKWFWAHYLNDEQMGLRRLGTKSSQTLRTRRCYGAGGERWQLRRLDLTDGVPRCPS